MRMALKSTTKGQRRMAKDHPIPAPIGGWNARDSLASMPPTDAVQLENWYPATSWVEMRGGYKQHTVLGPKGRTLLIYNGANGTNQLFLAQRRSIDSAMPYTGGNMAVLGLSTATAITNSQLYWTMFADGTTNWMIALNGADNPLYYNGSTWLSVTASTSPALTGMTPLSELIYPNVFKGRLFFLQRNTLRFWYLTAGAAGGALTSFNLGAECKRGGYLVAMSSWTRDAGDGQDDVAVFITSEGEAIVYQGNNPSVAASWSKIGSFYVGRPLGRRCMAQFGGDCIILTENGTFPLSSALQTASINSEAALSYKIDSAFTEAVQAYGTQVGWRVIFYPKKNALIVNVPHQEGGVHEQFVMNTITKAWCKFTGWNAEDFAVFNGNLYFTYDYNINSEVVLAWVGTQEFVKYDDSQTWDPRTSNIPITATAKQAFSYLANGSVVHVSQYRPILLANGSVTYQPDVNIDFEESAFVATTTYTTPSAIWDGTDPKDMWDQAVWAEDADLVKQWTTPAVQPGFAVSPKLKIQSETVTVKWIASDLVYETGGLR